MTTEKVEIEFSIEGVDDSTDKLVQLRLAQQQAADTAQTLARQIKELEKSGKASAAEIDKLKVAQVRAAESARTLGAAAERVSESQRRVVATGRDLLGYAQQSVGAFANLSSAINDVIQKNNSLSDATRRTTGHLNEQAQALANDIQQFGLFGVAVNSARTALETFQRIREESGGNLISSERTDRFAQRLVEQEERADLLVRLQEGQGTEAEYEAEIRRLRGLFEATTRMEARGDRSAAGNAGQFAGELGRIQAGRDAARLEAQRQEELQQEIANAAGRSGTRNPMADEAEMNAQKLRAASDYNEERDRIEQEAADARQQQLNEIAEQEQTNRQRRVEAAQEEADQIKEIEQRVFEERLQKMEELKERQREEMERVRASAQQVTGPVVGGLTDALSSIIAGTESADKAFAKLLSGFLSMISQQSALKAAFEFAEAISSFARYDFGGGAGHLAAGVAFTAVAVATGAGAIAVQPPASAAPASPQRGRDEGSGEGQTINVYWNSPMITYGDTAEVGRRVGEVVGQAQTRYAASV